MHIKSTLFALIPLLALGCVGEDEREKIDSILQDLEQNIETAQSCNQKDATSTQNRISKTLSAEDFGDGSDGEFYLPNEGVFYLEEKVYNFSNVNLDPGSVVKIADTAEGEESRVEINSLGVCNIYNAFDIADYSGEIVFRCYASFDIHGALYWADSKEITIRHGLIIEGEGDSGANIIFEQRGEIFGDPDMEVVFQIDGSDDISPDNPGSDIDDGAVVIGGDSDILLPPPSGGNTIIVGGNVTDPELLLPINLVNDGDTASFEPGTIIVLPADINDTDQVSMDSGDVITLVPPNEQTPEIIQLPDNMEATITPEGALQLDIIATAEDEADADPQSGDGC